MVWMTSRGLGEVRKILIISVFLRPGTRSLALASQRRQSRCVRRLQRGLHDSHLAQVVHVRICLLPSHTHVSPQIHPDFPPQYLLCSPHFSLLLPHIRSFLPFAKAIQICLATGASRMMFVTLCKACSTTKIPILDCIILGHMLRNDEERKY